MVERGVDYIIVEKMADSSPNVSHFWQYFATPESPPRSLIEYVAI